MKEIPLAIGYPRPDEPGHFQADLAWFSGGEASGHYIHAVVVIDRYLLWVEVESCMGRSREAVLAVLKEALSRMLYRPKTLQTDNGHEFLNDHLRFFLRRALVEAYKRHESLHEEVELVSDKRPLFQGQPFQA